MPRRISKKSDEKHEHARKKYHPPPGPRPLWSGVITFGLVSVPVQLYPATRRRAVSLRMLTREGKPVGRRYFCPEHDQEIHPEHLVRGYELENGDYVIVYDEELDDVAAEKSREIDLRRFVDLRQVPVLLYENAYVLTPAGSSNKAYRLLAAVMEEQGRAGIATFVMREKEHVVAILAEKGILRAETLRFQDEIRTPEAIGLPETDGQNKQKRAELTRLIKQNSKPDFAPDALHDEYAELLHELIAKKRKSGTDVVEAPGVEASADGDEDDDGESPRDLLDTIRRSLQGDGESETPSKRRKHQPSKHPSKKSDKLEERSKEDLYAQAKKRDIPGRSQMTKQQLIRALRA